MRTTRNALIVLAIAGLGLVTSATASAAPAKPAGAIVQLGYHWGG